MYFINGKMKQKLKVKWLFIERKRDYDRGDKDRSYTSVHEPCFVDLILELQKNCTHL